VSAQLAALGVFLPAAGAWAAPDFSYGTFAPASGVTVNGAAGFSGGALRLTPASAQQSGSAWHSARVPVAAGFTSSFSFRASDMGGSGDASGHVGADGFAFVIQPVSTGAVVLGANGRGGNIGYSSLARAVVVEFDTWFNGPATAIEPDGHHVALVSGGMGPVWASTGTMAVGSLEATLADGLLHEITVDYDGSVLEVIVDSRSVLSAPIDIGSTLGLSDGGAFVGFTAATGGGWENHDIVEWDFATVPGPGATGALALGAAIAARRRRPR
jgi:hypothetical protein